MYQIGIDIGGTNVKIGLLDETLELTAEASIPFPHTTAVDMAKKIRAAVLALLEERNASLSGVESLGAVVPGSIDAAGETVVDAHNLNFHNVPLRKILSDAFPGIPVYIANDANAAALGEVVAGCAQNVDSAVILTLGTGVGSGVVLNGKILTGCTGGAAELGHMVVEDGGALCACGRKGCFETYASATGLIRMAKEAMAQHPESLLHATAAEVGDVNGQTIFRAKEQGDPTAVAVVERYIHYLSVGIANVINCFYPEVVALSGGIANQGEALLAPLREAVAPQVYGNQYLQTHTRILGCTLGYHAGIIGAAMLPTAL